MRFLGQRADVPRLMAAADIFCQPDIGPEPFGIVFIEALYAGLPVVTSAFGGAVEIVDETCGILTAPGDTAAVATAVRSLIQDPSRRQPGCGGLSPGGVALRPGPSTKRGREAPAVGGRWGVKRLLKRTLLAVAPEWTTGLLSARAGPTVIVWCGSGD